MSKCKKELNLFELYCAIIYLKQAMLISLDLYKYKSDDNIEQNVLIQDNIITKDFNPVIKASFTLYNENYHPNRILYECIELSEVVSEYFNIYIIIYHNIHSQFSTILH